MDKVFIMAISMAEPDFKIEKLHTAARRCCIECHERWVVKYQNISNSGRDMNGDNYTEEALNIFPRYNVLKAILDEVEKYIPSDFASMEEAKNLLKKAAWSAENIFTSCPIGPIDNKAMQDERKKFIEYLDRLNDNALVQVPDLFYRRVLKNEESDLIWNRIQKAWDITGDYWYPLSSTKQDNIEAFQDEAFHKNVNSLPLRSILSNRGIFRIWEMREYGTEYQEDLSIFEPYYNGAEGYWCSDKMDWIIYASHEDSITVGGWLLEEVKNIWPSWKSHIWTM